jgi:solute carrier family 25 iron transporter 28/37
MDEPRPHNVSPIVHMIAGASAGLMEHVGMYPFDTVKTRLQTASSGLSMSGQLVSIVRNEGFTKLFSGMTAVIAGAVPAHAFYFAAYEATKKVTGADKPGHHPIGAAFSGAVAVLFHDAVSTPVDVVKQRMQLPNSPHTNPLSCARAVFLREGLRAFYVSYPTTVLMSIPQVAVHFAAYETTRTMLGRDSVPHDDHEDEEYTPWKHVVAGVAAGASAALVSTPLDVIKTRLQTQGELGIETDRGLADVARKIWNKEGARGFLRGASARMVYMGPSAAVCWTTYEWVKWMFT